MHPKSHFSFITGCIVEVHGEKSRSSAFLLRWCTFFSAKSDCDSVHATKNVQKVHFVHRNGVRYENLRGCTCPNGHNRKKGALAPLKIHI